MAWIQMVRLDYWVWQAEGGGEEPPANSYVAEDGVTPYVTEDGLQFYVTES